MTEGHNSRAADERLGRFIERVERLEEEKKGTSDDIKDVYSEAKAVGYDTRAMREMVKLRKMHRGDLEETEAIRDTYARALGLWG